MIVNLSITLNLAHPADRALFDALSVRGFSIQKEIERQQQQQQEVSDASGQ